MAMISGGLPGWFRRRGKRDNEADEKPSGQSAKSSSAVTGGDGETEPVVVYEASNRMEAEIVKGHLESEGIPAIITGDVAANIFGFHTGELAKADVLVPAPLADRAIAILDAAFEAATANDDLDEDMGEFIESKGEDKSNDASAPNSATSEK